ncbi:hypothetical protein H2203_009110 [Taxawa tesnikishii (nom. ined.)]|nr:hypothetical protein H2203_009110 [Dothideales sp. JES 119]
MNADDLIKQLDARRRAYEDTLRQFQEALGQTFVLPSLPEPHYGPSSPRSASQPSLVFSESDSRKRDTDSRRKQSYPLKSTLSISDDSDDESDLSLYVQTPLPARSCELGDLQKHIKSYKFDEYGRKILGDVESGPWTFPGPNDSTDKTTEYSQFQVFDVGSDGAPLPVELHTLRGRRGIGKEMAIWHTFKDLNNDPNKERKAVGRITIAREPSKIMFAALHHTYNSAFDMDDLFKHLVESEASSVSTRELDLAASS